MIYDIHRRYPRGYVHRHKCHVRTAPFKSVGQSEVVMLVGQLDRLIKGNGEVPTTTLKSPTNGIDMVYTMKTIYDKPPHIIADNLFTSEGIMDFLGDKGYGMTGTCARNCIPADLKPYTHHTKVDATHGRCRAMRFENPIVAIKQSQLPKKGKPTQRHSCHSSLQEGLTSLASTIFLHVNYISTHVQEVRIVQIRS